MGRVIRIGAILMGVLLVTMTGGLGALRASSEPLPTMVVLIEAEYGKQYYALFEAQSGKFIPITPTYFAITGKGISPDGHWVYFVETQEREESGGDILSGRLRRVALIPHAPDDQLLLAGINFRDTVWSPDFKWLFYTDYTVHHLFVANPLTGQRYDLTSELPADHHIHSIRPSEMGFDGEWVMFAAWDDARFADVHYRVRLDGTGLEPIGNIDGMSISFSKPENAHWYVGHENRDYDNLYRVRDDLQASFLIELPEHNLYDTSFRYWLTDEIVLLQCRNGDLTHNTILAVRMTDGQILWMVNHVVEHQYLPEKHWVFFRHYDFTNHTYIMEVISPDGTERRVVPLAGGDVMDDTPLMDLFDWNSDSDWWFYAFYNFRMGRFELHRLSADWKTDELLWMDKYELAFHRWQDKNLIFSANTGYFHYAVTALYQLDSDTLEIEPIMQPTSRTSIIDMNGPTIEHDFQLIPLMVIGSGLMMVTLLWRWVDSRELHH